MKNWKLIFILLIVTMLVGFLGSSSTNAQGPVQIYLPLIFKTRTKIPTSFGVQMSSFTALPQAAEANNYWVRYNGLLWSKVQPDGPKQWLWANYASLDEDLAAANRAGMEVILIVRSAPLWAQKRDDGNFCGPIKEENFDDFAEFMYHVVDKYSAPPYDVKYYEIWNEPDAPYQLVRDHPHAVYGCWGDPDDPDGYFGGGYYGKMLKTVYPQVKAASSGQAQVVLGSQLLPKDPEQAPKDWVHPSVSYNDYEIYWPYSDQSKFFEGILRECGANDCFDYVNFNGYAFYGSLGSTGIQLEKDVWYWKDRGGQVEGKLKFLKEKMAEYGVSHKPIIQAEGGLPLPNLSLWNDWDSAQRATYEAAKADHLVFLYTRNLAKGIAGTNWYHFDKYGWNRGGLLDSNNNPLPAYDAYKVLTGILQGAVFQDDLSLSAGMRGFEFRKNTIRLWVLFSEDGQIKTINQPDKFIRAYDLFGAPVVVENNQINFSRPIYVELYP